MIWAILLLISALSLSAMSAYFSVTGMMEIFSATPISIMFMMIALEASKVISAAWLHKNWASKTINVIHKGYMTLAVIVLMMITALGIYGFLAKGHLDQKAPVAGIEMQIDLKNQQIAVINQEILNDQQRLRQLDSSVESLNASNKAQQAIRYGSKSKAERKELQARIAADQQKVIAMTQEVMPLKSQVNTIETKLGPIKYVAQLFGVTDTEGAVRIIILMLMFVFDPLAIIMVISATITLDQKLKNSVTQNPIETTISEAYNPNYETDSTKNEASDLSTDIIDGPTPVITEEVIENPLIQDKMGVSEPEIVINTYDDSADSSNITNNTNNEVVVNDIVTEIKTEDGKNWLDD